MGLYRTILLDYYGSTSPSISRYSSAAFLIEEIYLLLRSFVPKLSNRNYNENLALNKNELTCQFVNERTDHIETPDFLYFNHTSSIHSFKNMFGWL